MKTDGVEAEGEEDDGVEAEGVEDEVEAGLGWAGLCCCIGGPTEANIADPDSAEVGILIVVPFIRTDWSSRSTSNLLALRKSAPTSGNCTAALRKDHLKGWPPKLAVLVTGPHERITAPPAPRRGGPRAGAVELCGTTE